MLLLAWIVVQTVTDMYHASWTEIGAKIAVGSIFLSAVLFLAWLALRTAANAVYWCNSISGAARGREES